MRPYWVFLPLFGALVSSADAGGARLAKRQDESTSSSPAETTTEVTTSDEVTETSTTEEPTTTAEGEDTTVTVTTTVEGEGETVSSRTTRTITSTTVIVNVSTQRETTTVTSRDQATATETVYTTTTVFERRKRDVWMLEIVEPEEAPVITPAPGLDIDSYNSYNAEIKRDAHPGPNVFKRDTITVTDTVTEGGGDTTVFATVTRTVVTATTSRSTTTETITETEQADASTTVTTTITFTETTNTMSTGVFTETGPTSDPTETNGSDSGSGGGGAGGLSTGAKAGIGAGVGVAGLALIAGLAWFCFKKRRGGDKHDGHDDMFGSSEVPVGAAAAGAAAAPMRHQPSTSTSYGPVRSPVLPNVAPEGYRGTALGDGRAGYAKPDPYGGSYTRPSAQQAPPTSVSPVSPPTTGYSYPTNRTSTLVGSGNGADQLPEHQTPADMNNFTPYGAAYRGHTTSPGPQAAELGNEGHTARWQSPGATEVDTTPAGYNQSQQPPSNVYEMPSQDTR